MQAYHFSDTDGEMAYLAHFVASIVTRTSACLPLLLLHADNVDVVAATRKKAHGPGGAQFQLIAWKVAGGVPFLLRASNAYWAMIGLQAKCTACWHSETPEACDLKQCKQDMPSRILGCRQMQGCFVGPQQRL